MEKAKIQELFSQHIAGNIPPKIRNTLLLRAFGLVKIPLLFSVQPTVVELSDERAVVRIKLSRWTRNHWGSMYFGTLAMGADCAVGMIAMHHIWKNKANKVQLIFKDFRVDFLKRPDGDVLFICDEGEKTEKTVLAARDGDERQNVAIKGRAVLEKKPDEPVAEFQLTLSLKRKG